jgi:class 3 adenylate cyclase
VGALAGAGEILVSVDTLEGVDVITTGEPREVELKGFAKPVRVVAVDWRAAGR